LEAEAPPLATTGCHKQGGKRQEGPGKISLD
jgi:hypothetical protein